MEKVGSPVFLGGGCPWDGSDMLETQFLLLAACLSLTHGTAHARQFIWMHQGLAPRK